MIDPKDKQSARNAGILEHKISNVYHYGYLEFCCMIAEGYAWPDFEEWLAEYGKDWIEPERGAGKCKNGNT